MKIKLLRSKTEYKEWLSEKVNPETDSSYDKLLDQTEMALILEENRPTSYPCLAYTELSSENHVEEIIIYVYKEQVLQWSAMMQLYTTTKTPDTNNND